MAGGLRATVVGGGIGGLAAAVALARAGWRATVVERAPAFGEAGAGLGVTPNGMTALGALGVAADVRAAGHPVRHAGYQDPRGRWLLRFPDGPGSVLTFWGLHRRRLHGALLDAAGRADGVTLVTGAEVTSVRPGAPGGEPATVTWQASTGTHTGECELVVAADGVGSAVRTQLFPGVRPRYAGATSWRAIVPDTGHDDRYIETWGPGTSFGALRISDTEVYWYGDFLHPEGASVGDELDAARRHFAGWSPRVRALIAATAPDRLIRNDIYHLPGLPTYVRGRVVVIGDAAHAMVPNSGHGSATALEDAVCVGRMVAAPVAAGAGLAAALAAFDRARRPRCRRIARQGLMMARFGDGVAGGRRLAVRDALLRLVPAGLAARAGAGSVRWTPPPAVSS